MASSKRKTPKKAAPAPKASKDQPKAATPPKPAAEPKPEPKPEEAPKPFMVDEPEQKPVVVKEVVDAPVEKEELPKAVRVEADPNRRIAVIALVSGKRNIGNQRYILEKDQEVRDGILLAHLEMLEGAGAVKRKA